MDAGTQLRNARQQRGVTIEQVAERTKISLRILRAIERNAFDQLPGGVFTRGFLRAYAREVGLPPEDVVRDYVSEFEPPEPAQTPADEKTPDLPRPFDASKVESFGQRPERSQLFGTAIVALLGAAVYFLLAREPREPVPSVPAPAATPRTESGTPAGRRGSTPAGPAVGTAGTRADGKASPTDDQRAGVRLELHPDGPCWASVIADGSPAFMRLMKAGERATIDARQEAVVRLGDAGACALSIDGVPANKGRARTPVTLRIRKGDYRQLVQ